jgi:hypothetical protein
MWLRSITLIVLVALLGYGAIEARPLVMGPSIQLDSPKEGAVSTDGNLTIAGTAYRTKTLILDGAPLLIDQAGHFSRMLTLPSGGAILSLTATDRFGRHATETRNVVVK